MIPANRAITVNHEFPIALNVYGQLTSCGADCYRLKKYVLVGNTW